MKRAGFQVQPRNKDTQTEVLQDTSDTLSNSLAIVLFNPITYATDNLRLFFNAVFLRVETRNFNPYLYMSRL